MTGDEIEREKPQTEPERERERERERETERLGDSERKNVGQCEKQFSKVEFNFDREE